MLKDCDGAPELILIATGSEVDLAMQAAAQLGGKVRVVSMPSTDVFDRQPPSTANRCCRAPAASASRSKPASPTSGASTSASTAR